MRQVIPLFIAIPIGSAIIILIVGKFSKLIADIIAFLSSSALVVFSLLLLGGQTIVYRMGGWYPPIGITIYVDQLTTLMLLIVNVIAFLAIFFSLTYMRDFTDRPKYWALFLLMLAGMNGVLVTGDLFNLFVFLEIASIASYALVAFGVEAEELEASFKYLVIGSMGSSFILLGIALIYSYTGSVNMGDVGNYLMLFGKNRVIMFATALFIMGFGIKAALVPFHAWLPDAHPAAPAPISAMLSGVLIKTLGIYAITRIFYNVLGFSHSVSTVLLILGGLSLIVGSSLSVVQDDMKRLLAYCTIGQVGYIIVGIGLGTPLGIAGALFHIMNHAVNKSLLFLNSGAIERATGTRDMKEMGGVMHVMPVTGTTTVIGSLSMCGIPPFNAFWSKLLIFMATLEAHQYLLTALLAFETLMTILAFAKVLRYVVFAPAKKAVDAAPFPMYLPGVVLSTFCVILGISYAGVLQGLVYPAQAVLLDKLVYIKTLLGG